MISIASLSIMLLVMGAFVLAAWILGRLVAEIGPPPGPALPRAELIRRR